MIYSDRAKTGRNFNRPAFKEMMDDASKHLFDIIVVYQLDRFGNYCRISIRSFWKKCIRIND